MAKAPLNRYDKIMAECEALPFDQRRDFLLEQIALIQPSVMLQDLMNEGARSPALYNAVTALLKYYKIEINPLAGANQAHTVGALAHGLPPADFLAGDEYMQ